MGGGVAWQLALRHPERIDALILVDAGRFPNEKPPAKIRWRFASFNTGWDGRSCRASTTGR